MRGVKNADCELNFFFIWNFLIVAPLMGAGFLRRFCGVSLGDASFYYKIVMFVIAFTPTSQASRKLLRMDQKHQNLCMSATD
jgi:hypothetical protein